MRGINFTEEMFRAVRSLDRETGGRVVRTAMAVIFDGAEVRPTGSPWGDKALAKFLQEYERANPDGPLEPTPEELAELF